MNNSMSTTAIATATYPLEIGQLIFVDIPQDLHSTLLYMPPHGLVDLHASVIAA